MNEKCLDSGHRSNDFPEKIENAVAYLKSIFYKIEFQKNLQCSITKNCL
jgi:hypothetical protein